MSYDSAKYKAWYQANKAMIGAEKVRMKAEWRRRNPDKWLGQMRRCHAKRQAAKGIEFIPPEMFNSFPPRPTKEQMERLEVENVPADKADSIYKCAWLILMEKVDPNKGKRKSLAYYYRNHKRLKSERASYMRAKYAALSSDEKKALRIKLRPYLKRIRQRPYNRMVQSLRVRISKEIKKEGTTKNELGIRTMFGCSTKQLRAHIESKFTKRMNWNNYGSYWHVDHIIPCCAYDLTIQSQVDACFHWTNLRPLTAKANSKKSGAIIDGQQSLLLPYPTPVRKAPVNA